MKLIKSEINKFMIIYVSNLVAMIQQFLLGHQSTSADRKEYLAILLRATSTPTHHIFYLTCIDGLLQIFKSKMILYIQDTFIFIYTVCVFMCIVMYHFCSALCTLI